MTSSKMPRRFWSYTAGKGNTRTEEIEAARARDFHVVTLGGRILRAETAAIAVTVLMQHQFGDLK